MIKFENTIKSFRKGEQTLDELLATIERLVKHDGVKPEIILAEVNKENNEFTLAPSIISAIKHRLYTDHPMLNGQQFQGSEELQDTIDYDDTLNEIETINKSGSHDPQKTSSSQQENAVKVLPDMRVPSSDKKKIGLLGKTLNERYELVAYIGSGGMGSVYKAIDRKQLKAGFKNPNVAIKVLHRKLSTQKDLYYLQQEANRCRKLNHPYIVEVYGADQDDTISYLIMEFLSGKPLKDMIGAASFTGLPIEEAFHIISAMGEALAFAHDKGIIHYDFKPSNVIITEDNKIKVIDFGIAKVLRDSDKMEWAAPAVTAVTPAYASPEMLKHSTPDPRDDIFAFACTTYELLTGRHPFGRKWATEAMTLSLPAEAPHQLASSQWQALEKALEFDRNKRTNDLKQLIEDLNPNELPLSANSILIRGIATSIVLSIAVVGTYLSSTAQERSEYLDSSIRPMQSDATPTVRTSLDTANTPHLKNTNPEPLLTPTQSSHLDPSPPELKTQRESILRSENQQRQTAALQNDKTTVNQSTPNPSKDSVEFASIQEPAKTTDSEKILHLKQIADALRQEERKLATLQKESLPARIRRPDRSEMQSLYDTLSVASPSPSLLLNSISTNSVQTVQLALNSGVSANTRNRSSGLSALMLAASKGNTEIIELLLRSNADINSRDKQRKTALFWAAVSNHSAAVKQLLDYGARADLRDQNGETALMQVAWAGHSNVVQELVKKDAGINFRDPQGLTALTVASINGHTAIVETLLNAGANPDLGMADGKTALMAAAWNGHTDIVRLLSERNCSLDTTNAEGWTALISAAWNGHSTIVKDLVKAGANPNITNKNQMSAAQVAKNQGFMDIANFLEKTR